MKFAARIVSGLLLAAILAGGLHRHEVHGGGLSSEHVDCAVCSWSPRGQQPSTGSGDVFFAPSAAPRLLPLPETPRTGFFFSRSFQSRAPPSQPQN
jgi:hypothetical protein